MATPEVPTPKVAPMKNLFGPVPAGVAQVPGAVTSAGMLSPTANTPLSGGTTRTTITQGNTSSDWARAAAANNASQQRKLEEKEAARRKQEAEAKLRDAYATVYGPSLQSQWDVLQGQYADPGPAMTQGHKNPGFEAYKIEGPEARFAGHRPFVYRPDTNMPTDQYNQALNQGFDLWKAMMMLGVGGGK